ncbi:MAG: tape measure protein [Cypionkella sp.]
MDLATLGIAITSDGVVVAKDRLKHFEDQAKRTDTATGALSRSFGLLKGIVAGLAAAFGIRELAQLTSAWTDLNSRVNNAAGSMEKGTAVMGRLTDMSRRTYSSLSQTAESWLQNASSLQAMGYSTEQQLDLTEALNNALVISATRGDRAASVMNAWSKAMDIGKLSGENFNSVVAGSDRLAQALADSMGVSVLKLRGLAAQGKITAKDMFGVSKELAALREEADAMPATIQDAMVLMGNAVLEWVGKVDAGAGASSAIAQGIIGIADSLRDSTSTAVQFAAIVGNAFAAMSPALTLLVDNLDRGITYAATFAAYMAVQWVASLVSAAFATATLSGALAVLRGALIRTGIGALVVLAGELIFQFMKLVDETGGLGEAFGELGRRGVETWGRINSGAAAMSDYLDGVSLSIVASFIRAWANIASGFAGLMGAISGGLASVGINVDMSGMDSYMKGVQTRAAAFEATSTNAFNSAGKNWAAATAPSATSSTSGAGRGATWGDMQTFASRPASLAGDGSAGGVISGGGAGGGAAKKNPYTELLRDGKLFIEQQNLEAQALGMTEEAAARLKYEQEMLNKAANDNINLTPQQTSEIGLLATAMAAAESATKKAKDAFDFAKGAVKGFLSDMRQGLSDGKSLWESFGGAAMGVLDKVINKIEDQLVDALFSLGGMGGGGGGGIFGFLGGLLGFASGGYTGNKATSQVAGVVHGGEYVFSAKATNRIGVANLDAMHSSAKGYAGGGYVGAPPVMDTPANSGGNLTITTRMEVVGGNLVPVMTEVAGEVAGQRIQQASPAIVGASVSQANKSAPGAVSKHQAQRGNSDFRLM